jgi:hypothetical protein
MSELAVGQELWFVPSQRYLGQPCAVTVAKVGRVWAYTGHRGYRINLQTLTVDSGSADPYRLGQCYLDRAAYEAEQERQRLWGALRQHLDRHYTAPVGVTAEQIKTAAAALNLLDANDPQRLRALG